MTGSTFRAEFFLYSLDNFIPTDLSCKGGKYTSLLRYPNPVSDFFYDHHALVEGELFYL